MKQLLRFIFPLVVASLGIQNLPAQTAKFAKGMVIYRGAPGVAPDAYKGMLFVGFNSTPAWVDYSVGASQPVRLSGWQVVREIHFGGVFESDFIRPEHLAAQTYLQSTLVDAATQSPKLADVTKGVADAIQAQIDQFQRGMVRYRGKWMDQSEYAQVMKGMEDSDAVLRERSRNLRSAYGAEVVKPLLADFTEFSHTTGILSTSAAYGASTNLGKLEPGLKARSKMLPGSSSLNIEVGLYASESADGPAVLWAAKDDNLLTLDIGICIKTDADRKSILNADEFAQAKYFISKFDESLIEAIPDALAAAKIRSVLKPGVVKSGYVMLQREFIDKSNSVAKRGSTVLIGLVDTKKGDFALLQKESAKSKASFLIGKPVTLNDGSIRQFLIMRLF